MKMEEMTVEQFEEKYPELYRRVMLLIYHQQAAKDFEECKRLFQEEYGEDKAHAEAD